MRSLKAAILTCVLCHTLTGCASGRGYTENFFNQIKPLDAAVLLGAGILIYTVGNTSPWDVEVAPLPNGAAYKVTLRRAILASGGDGDSNFLFRQEAERITLSQSCAGYRILRYEERLETVYIGARRVAEGIIECVKA